ncbi:unnamed protein product [Pleuronectes platessa]|uniref:Uncharacterized protein n=1 Tax=Pleuronectes platessa TaxID=8262 RepID=A0A9N7YFU5_PLEPL|nr:unnamed protein product [Pleuronectes platessa]
MTEGGACLTPPDLFLDPAAGKSFRKQSSGTRWKSSLTSTCFPRPPQPVKHQSTATLELRAHVGIALLPPDPLAHANAGLTEVTETVTFAVLPRKLKLTGGRVLTVHPPGTCNTAAAHAYL